MPDSILLFGNYNDLRVVTQKTEQMPRPPVNEGTTVGISGLTISPRGASVA
jgi:hypothetical protein